MTMRKKLLSFLTALGWCWIAVASSGNAAQLDNVAVGYSSFTGHYAPLWIAVEAGLGRK
jgi:hypothetical protein